MAKPQRAKGRTRRRVRKNIAIGQAHIKTSFNNTLVTLTDQEGNVIAWESAGSVGFIQCDMSARRVLGEPGQVDDRRALVNAEGVGLVVPVHVPRRPGVAVRVVLGLLVVTENAFCR